ncbi:MAG: helix-hairpin-helix domain-containing protein [Parasporobacterium sp.]|nr:helix-hairpin-helix domain-containing protein [Parasporobacterium sp.]
MKNKNLIKVLLVALVFVVAGVVFSCTLGKKKPENSEEEVLVTEEESISEAEISEEESSAELICVHVCGCVAAPGVYYLPKGARVHEAVEMAGGMTESADHQYINLAKEASDGSKIYIPSTEEVAGGLVPAEEETEGSLSDGLVNINTATLDELKTLPGIGDVKANAILAYRESAGSFSSIEEIMNVAGIKESSYEKIKNFIKV